MMAEDPAQPWAAPVSQIVALATFVGVLAGTLRVKGHLLSEELEQVFQLADELLPEQTGTDGAFALSAIRKAARAIKGEPQDGEAGQA